MKRVLILNMPFVSLARPAIGVSQLKACLADKGISCDVGYANLLLAELVGFEAYDLVDRELSLALFPGDWLFAQYAFSAQLDQATYLHTLRHHVDDDAKYNEIMNIRDTIDIFIKKCFEQWRFEEYDIIGFTTTFQQNLASLVLSGLIKKEFPEKIVVFGGGNCEGAMGLQLHRSFEWIDYVCSGESDNSFPELVQRIERGESVGGIPGVIYRDGGDSVKGAPEDYIQDLNALPIPDFSDYFTALDQSPISSKINSCLQIECSRGCWWGAKSHCRFCGLNGQGMNYRFKSAPRVLDEIKEQVGRFKLKHVNAVDNVMPLDYFTTLLPQLKTLGLGVSFFFEVRANLRAEQIRLLREAGIIAVQPGVESLSTNVLKLMKKGVSAIQNVQLLKYCREFGVEAAWNLLYGFPGETADDYRQMAELISAIPHLRPPGSVKPIRLDRFSPYFINAQEFGIVNIRPFSMYRFVYPLAENAIADLVPYFEYDYADGRKPGEYVEDIPRMVDDWLTKPAGDLVMTEGDDGELMIIDTRNGRQPIGYPLKGLQREIYEYCSEVKNEEGILAFFENQLIQEDTTRESVQLFLQRMTELKLMVREGDRYLSVAVSDHCLEMMVGG